MVAHLFTLMQEPITTIMDPGSVTLAPTMTHIFQKYYVHTKSSLMLVWQLWIKQQN